jgi:hypothetical protein
MLRAIGVILSVDFFGVSLAWNKNGRKVEMEIQSGRLEKMYDY